MAVNSKLVSRPGEAVTSHNFRFSPEIGAQNFFAALRDDLAVLYLIAQIKHKEMFTQKFFFF